jgi:phage RecT family recombinase
MNTAVATKQPSAVAIVRTELERMGDQFRAALPAHIPVERFQRVIMTALQNNPDLIKCERASLWNSAMKAAQDGLLPDGREGAIVPYQGKAQWLPMIGGIRKKVRNSGELSTWDVHAVYEKDHFEFELGDSPFIRHKPSLDADKGKLIAVYSVATLKGGEKSRDVMSVSDVEKIRAKSRAKAGPWSDPTFYPEMAKKTVARRHSKVLPMSSDLDDLIRRDDHFYEQGEPETAPPRPKLVDFVNPDTINSPAVEDEPKADEPKAEAQADVPAPDEDPPTFGHKEARDLGIAHRDANRPMSAPPDLAQEFHEAFLDGWRSRDDEITAEAKKAAKK